MQLQQVIGLVMGEFAKILFKTKIIHTTADWKILLVAITLPSKIFLLEHSKDPANFVISSDFLRFSSLSFVLFFGS